MNRNILCGYACICTVDYVYEYGCGGYIPVHIIHMQTHKAVCVDKWMHLYICLIVFVYTPCVSTYIIVICMSNYIS